MRVTRAVIVRVGFLFGLSAAARRQVSRCNSGAGSEVSGRRTISGVVSGTGVSELANAVERVS
jgi:hypothetical protein